MEMCCFLLPVSRLLLFHPVCVYYGFLPSQRCSQLFPFLTLELSRAAFILPPQHTSSPMETPPRYDCFHTFMCFKQNTAENCLLILSGESSLTKQFAVDGGMWRHPLLPALHLHAHPHVDTLQTRPTRPSAFSPKYF